MHPTDDPEINALLERLLAELQAILGAHLVGVYLFGSLVTGDFDPGISDIDILAAVAADLDAQEFAALDRVHQALAAAYPAWDNRLEIAYVSTAALRTFKTARSPIAVISPGEPFHRKEAGRDWLLNWYVVREKGRVLFGPPAGAVIPPISREEFAQGVRDQAREWPEYVVHTRDSRPYQGHAIISMCRALYALRTGEQGSKKQAAAWASRELPEWAPLIARALAWRADYRNRDVDPEATYAETVAFVRDVSARIAPPPPRHLRSTHGEPAHR